MGKRTGGKRGAPVGNTNRLKHGRYTARRIARRAEVQALLRTARHLTRRIEMMAWSRKALRTLGRHVCGLRTALGDFPQKYILRRRSH